MSEVQSRPSAPRGRASSRGGRGAHSSRGGRGGTRQMNGHKTEEETATPSYEDEGEMGELKKTYSSSLSTVKEMFPSWTDEDIVYALQETEGDLQATIERISEGNISRWGEVKKKTKERSHSKAKDAARTSSEPPAQSARGGRGRGGFDSTRGGRGRGSDRGRGAGRGGRGGLANGSLATSAPKSEDAPAADATGWDNAPSTDGVASGSAVADSTPLESSWENITAGEAVPASAVEEPKAAPKPSSKPDGTRSWASMFNKPAPAPAPPKAPRTALSHESPLEPLTTATSMPTDTDMPGLPAPPINESSEVPSTPPTSDLATSAQAANITPSKDDLTETNLEQVLDVSAPAPAATAASTVDSTIDPHSVATPQQEVSRPPLGGFATSAYKATGMPSMPGRSASYQRKIQEQQEAVVMPGKHAVDRAAVQFGSMGLNGSSDDTDVDSDREDTETRAQPPQHSPIAPRAALPPAPQQQAFASQPQAEPHPTPRQAPVLPPISQHSSTQQPGQHMPGDQGVASQSQPNYSYNRYGPQASQQEVSAPSQKPYEPFGQQVQQSHQYDNHPSASQASSHPQEQAHSHQGGFSSAANDTSSYYTSDSQRNAYQNSYYGNHSQQPLQYPDSGFRGTSASSTSAAEQTSQLPTSQAQSQPQSRFGQATDAQNSGHSTPNLSTSGQQQPSQPHQMHQQQAQGQAGGQHGQYPYGHPYYASPYYSAYMNQFGYGGSQGGYGGGPFGGAGGKQGMYGQPHQGYGMSPQTSYDNHSASPANAGAFGQNHTISGRDSAAAGGLGSYGRSGSAQPSENPQQFSSTGANNHGSVPDVFGRSQPGYPGQSSGLGSHMGQQGGNEDSLRGYADPSKIPGGPSPALGQPGGRPGSAATPQSQSGLPPPGQSQGQQGYGGYMGQMHGQGGSQYGGAPGGLGGHHQYGGHNQQAGGYGGYGAGYGSSSYGNSNRGGWGGASYGH